MPTAVLDVSHLLTVIPDEADPRSEFARLAMICGWGSVDTTTLEVMGTDAVDVPDVSVTRRLNAAITSVLWARRDGDRIEAFAGAALIPVGNPLAAAGNVRSQVHVACAYRSEPAAPGPSARCAAPRAVAAPVTEWLVGAWFPGVAPHPEAMSALFADTGLHTIFLLADGHTHWRRIAPTPRLLIDSAIAELRRRHRVRLTAIRAL